MAERRDEAALDPVLERVHETSPVWEGQLANHAPMASEALVELGRTDALEAFFARYGANLEPAPTLDLRPLDDWQHHLGQRDAGPQLTGHFLTRVEDDGVPSVARFALPVLFEGVLGGSFHGLLRLAHALRGWRHRPSPVRVREVAHALGYWASEHTSVPGAPGADPHPSLTPADALAAIPPLPEDAWVDGIITVRALASAEHPPFLEAIRRVDFAAEPLDASIASLTETAAALFLATAQPRARFTYLHAITSTSALREVLPLVSAAERAVALRHHWHALAAAQCMTSTLRTPEERAAPAPVVEPVDLEAVASAAATSLDDHAIKLAAAARTESAHHDAHYVRMAAASYADSR